jgi:hypothetical protein
VIRCVLLALALSCRLLLAASGDSTPSELMAVKKTVTIIETFRPTPQFDRHDPSNIRGATS